MNRGKKQFTAKEAKKQKKEALHVLGAHTPEERSEPTHTWKILAKFPKRIATKDKAEVEGTKKRSEIKRKKLHSKHSKRTTPGQVELDITPYTHHHPEGKKMIKTIEKQSVAKGRRLVKKINKSSGR